MHQTSGMATLPPDNRYYQITNYKVCSFPSCCPWIFTALVGSHLWAWGYLQRWFLAICLKSRVYLLSTDPYHLLGNKNPAPCVSLCTCILSSCMCISTCAIHIYIYIIQRHKQSLFGTTPNSKALGLSARHRSSSSKKPLLFTCRCVSFLDLLARGSCVQRSMVLCIVNLIRQSQQKQSLIFCW
jgi:hypothetical protein